MWHKLPVFAVWRLGISLLAGVSLQGDPVCPSADQVRVALQSMMSTADFVAVTSVIRLAEVPGHVRVERLEESGAVEASRLVPVDSTACEQAAERVALLVALWEAQLESGVVLELPPEAPAPETDVPQSVSPQETPPVAPPKPLERQMPTRVESSASLGLFAERSGGSYAPAASLTLRVRGANGFGLAASFSVAGEHQMEHPAGAGARVHWQQSALALGPCYAATKDAFAPFVQLQLLTGLLRLRGSGFDRNIAGREWDFGSRAELGVLLGRGRLRPFVSAALSYRLRRQSVVVRGSDGGQALPHLELLLGAGVAWGGAS